MEKIEKDFNFKIISLILGLLFLFDILYYVQPVYSNSRTLRVPFGDYDRVKETAEKIASYKNTNGDSKAFVLNKKMSRRTFLTAGAIFGTAFGIDGLSIFIPSDTQKRITEQPQKLMPKEDISEQIQIQEIISKMTLKEKLGFLMMPSIVPSLDQQNIDYISDYYKLRAYLFDMYPVDYDGAVIKRILKTQAKLYSQMLPALVAMNMEGGWISLIQDAPFPGPMAVGATDSPLLAKMNGRMIGKTLAQIGININLAPVLDLYTNPKNRLNSTRSFGASPERVAKLGAAFIEGLQGEGVCATAKHFPGLGGAKGDSHRGIQLLDKNLAQLESHELVPFKAAIDAGVKIIMTGHLLVPQIDSKNPASLSKIFTTDILRQKLGFKGVVITDDVRMKAITSKSKGMGLPIQEATIRAVEAGADIILGPRREVYEGLKQGLASKRITEQRLNESIARIIELQLHRSTANFTARKPYDIFRDPEIQNTVKLISEKAVTVIKNSPQLLPIRINPSDKMLVIHPELINDVGKHNVKLREYVKVNHKNTDFMPMDVEPTNEQKTAIVNAIDNYSYVIFTLYDQPYKSDQLSVVKQIEILKAILTKKSNVIVILLKNPYYYNSLPKNVPVVLATYGKEPALLQAAVDIIFGAIKDNGNIPIKVKLNENIKASALLGANI